MKKYAIILTLALAWASAALAQVTTPYSMYGYGILGDGATSMQKQMGSVGYAMNSGRQINFMNPASYAAIDSLTFLFDMGADVSMLWQKEGDVRERSTGGGLDYITMQFPLSKYMGASIGMVPYSSVGYAFGKDIKHGAMQNQGSGGINEAYAGVAGTYAGFSLGLNVAYRFGTILNDYYATPNTTGNALVQHILKIRDWDINIGAQYTVPIRKTERLTVGLSFTPRKSLHGNAWVLAQESASSTSADTVAHLNVAGNYETPESWGAGVSWTHERSSRWMVEADVQLQKWSQVKYSPMYDLNDPDKLVFKGMNFKNRTRLALGGEYVPRVRGNYIQRCAFRAGAYWCNDYLNINGNRVREYGVTAGIGLNAPEGKTMVNLGVEWKHRQANPNPLIKENYLNITLGINFNELWFYQRKIR